MDLEELAEAAYWEEGREVKVREDLRTERMVDGEVETVWGDEYIFEAPVNVSNLLTAARNSDSMTIMEISVTDEGTLNMFIPRSSNLSGRLFDQRHDNEIP
jgi:hypothetical protein